MNYQTINGLPQDRNKKNLPNELIGINYLIPNVICKLLASGTILINLYWSKNHEVQLMGMGVATLFSFVFGYLLIMSLNLGLAYEIGRRRNSPNNIGIYYQRALVINFIVCAFLITPILYISKKIVILFVHIDEYLAIIISDYLFQLAPSIYLFAFYDTTQTFLLAQGHYLAALVINIFGFFCHFFFIGHLGAAWSKNLTDCGRCIAIYLHLALRPKKLQSWIEWTIQCFKGWSNYMQFYKNIGLSTYVQSLFLFIFAAYGYLLPRAQLICHICFINIIQMIFIINIGLKEGLIIKLAYFIKQNKIRNLRSIGVKSLKIFFFVSLFIIFLIFMYINQICDFFLTATAAKQIFLQNYWIMFIAILIDSSNLSLFTIIKAFIKNYPLLRYQIPFILIFASLMSYLFCYKLQFGLVGLWYGWIIGSSLHTLFNWFILIKYQNIKYTVLKTKKQPLLANKRKQYQVDDD